MNDKRSKVTSIGQRDIGVAKSSSSALTAVQSIAESGTKRLLQSLFDNADDAFFELADRAESNFDQSCYFEAMREIRIQRQGIERQFPQNIAEGFLNLINGVMQDPEQGVSAENLSVVSNNELEERVAIESMVSKAITSYEDPLANLATRLDSLVAGITVTDKTNPVAPEAICRSFNLACNQLRIDIRAKLVLLKLFDRHVMSCLGEMYDLCNQVLIERGVLPGLDMTGLVQQDLRQSGPEVEESAEIPTVFSNDVFSDLRSLVTAQSPTSRTVGQSGLVGYGLAPEIPRPHLLQLLQVMQAEIQHQLIEQQTQALNGITPQQLDISQVLNQLLETKIPDQTLSLGHVDSDVINMIDMLFQFILDEPQLAPPLKALIARLQIPFIKLAMMDKQFFSKGNHPARQLLNTLAKACLGWEQVENVENDRLYKKIDELVTTVIDQFDSDTAIFQQLLDEFKKFIEAEERRAQLVQQRTLGAEEGKAKTELAREQVENLLDSKLNGLDLPEPVVQLSTEGWNQVLLHIFLKDGSESTEWQEAVALLDDLIWSVRPVENESARQQLLKRAPKIVKALRKGLATVSFNPVQLQHLFEAVEAIHMDRLEQALPDDSAEPPILTAKLTADELLSSQPVNKDETVVNGAIVSETGVSLDQLLEKDRADSTSVNKDALAELDAELNSTLGDVDALGGPNSIDKQPNVAQVEESCDQEHKQAPIEEDQEALGVVDSLSMGGWFELSLEEDSQCRCRLAAVIRATGKYIFVNRSGVKVAEYTRQSLAQAIKNSQVRQLDDGKLFDRALESVINDLRGKKSLQG